MRRFHVPKTFSLRRGKNLYEWRHMACGVAVSVDFKVIGFSSLPTAGLHQPYCKRCGVESMDRKGRSEGVLLPQIR